jgi:hypothetical protein
LPYFQLFKNKYEDDDYKQLEKQGVILDSSLYNRLTLSVASAISSELLFDAITVINK